MKISLLLILCTSFIIVNASAPTQNEVADAAWLSNQIYEGVNTMNTRSGCVIKSHQSEMNGAYAVWKHYRTKECFVVIRGTKNLNDFLTDFNILDIYDDEIDVHVHNGVRLRTEFILGDIDDKLKECKRDIIITGHSLGGSVSHYLFLKYVKRHYYDWNQEQKANRFKAVMFGAPQLTTRSGNQLLINYEKNINWYKYESDVGPELVRTIKNAGFLITVTILFSGQIQLSTLAFEALLSVNYGDYIPGNKYHLWNNGETEEYRYIIGKNFNIEDHVILTRTVDAITIKGWGTENVSPDESDTVNCLNLDFTKFLDEDKEEKSLVKDDSKKVYNDGTIDINTTSCENVDGYNILGKYQDVFFYISNDNSSYIIKRLLDNEKEYEYAICNNSGFILEQCDKNCSCHKVTKNDRPKKISMCSSYQLDSVMTCLIDGNQERVELTDYFSIMGQTKINNYYLMDYFCKNQSYERGNYIVNSNTESNYSKNLSTKFILFLLISIFL